MEHAACVGEGDREADAAERRGKMIHWHKGCTQIRSRKVRRRDAKSASPAWQAPMRKEVPMFKGKLNSSRIVAWLMVAAAIPLSGLTACDGGDEGKQPNPSSERVREDGECVAVRNWVAQNAGRLPTTYAELVRYPVAYRRGIFSALDPDTKSALWKEHFQNYRNEHPDLTAAQASFIERLSSSTSAELYKGATDEPAVKKGLQAEGSALFERDSLRLLVAQLGPDDEPDDAQECAAARVGSCTCNAGDDWCPWGQWCSNEGPECSITPDGCGWWGADPCDGLCVD